MIKPDKVYDFTLKWMNRYYFDNLAKYKMLMKYKNENRYPKIAEMHACIKELEYHAANPGIFSFSKVKHNACVMMEN
jgi:hypothetical protein